MITRIIAALVLIPVLLVVAIWAPTFVAAMLVGLMAGIASYELLYRTKLVTNWRLNVASAVMAFAVSAWSHQGAVHEAAVLGVLIYMVLIFAEMMISKLQLKVNEAMLCLLSGIVIPFMLTALVRILVMPSGRYYIFIPLVMAFLSDTGAYFVGVFFGKHKMAPLISPKKSWEGFIGGIVTAVLGMLAYAWILQYFFVFEVNYLVALLYGLVGALGGVFGDLSLSVIKRQTGIKDYGNLIPGHGGILDRFDSVLITAPLTEALLLLLPMAV